jgi:hypothetical protein
MLLLPGLGPKEVNCHLNFGVNRESLVMVMATGGDMIKVGWLSGDHMILYAIQILREKRKKTKNVFQTAALPHPTQKSHRARQSQITIHQEEKEEKEENLQRKM